ncbi:MAG TPA: hypothetical protein VNA17_02880, partial [Pyrinomonadaceae bacterium]|nr:hypothetical protein [Pyrinomonadaceae bacterium]
MKWLVIAATFAAHGAVAAQKGDQPRVFLLDVDHGGWNKKLSDPALRPAIDKIAREARGALKVEITSIVSKQTNPPSGDKHDYI